jgi:hypothetical protein
VKDRIEMKISRTVEPLVREALGAAVKRDWGRFARAMEAFPSEEDGREGLQLATAVALFVLHQEHGHPPSQTEIEQLAREIAEVETWTTLSQGEIRSGLLAMTQKGATEPGVPQEVLMVLPYVTAAYLLAGAVEPPKWWFNRLDEVEAAIDRAAPG